MKHYLLLLILCTLSSISHAMYQSLVPKQPQVVPVSRFYDGDLYDGERLRAHVRDLALTGELGKETAKYLVHKSAQQSQKQNGSLLAHYSTKEQRNILEQSNNTTGLILLLNALPDDIRNDEILGKYIFNGNQEAIETFNNMPRVQAWGKLTKVIEISKKYPIEFRLGVQNKELDIDVQFVMSQSDIKICTSLNIINKRYTGPIHQKTHLKITKYVTVNTSQITALKMLPYSAKKYIDGCNYLFEKECTKIELFRKHFAMWIHGFKAFHPACSIYNL